jgi:hypothetical protein
MKPTDAVRAIDDRMIPAFPPGIYRGEELLGA